MNIDNLPIYNSTDTLSFPIEDYFNTYILPIICLFGIITNIINILVFKQIKLNNETTKYFITNSCCDLAFLSTQVFLFIFRCGTLCPYNYKYGAKLYEKYIYLYTGYVISNFCLLLDISTSLNIFSSFQIGTNNNKLKLTFEIKCVIFLIISLLICLPNYIIYLKTEAIGTLAIYDKNLNATYEILYRLNLSCQNDFITKTIVSILRLIRGSGLYTLLLILNVLIAYKLKKHILKKKNMVLIARKYLNEGK